MFNIYTFWGTDQLCVYCTKLEPIFKIGNVSVPRALRASVLRTELSKNGKCGERIRTPLAEYGDNPERKNTPCISDLAGVKFFLKKERVFFLSGFCPPSIRSGGVQMQFGLGFAKLFSGDLDFAKPRLIYFGGNSDWVPARRRGLGRNPRGLLGFFANELTLLIY